MSRNKNRLGGHKPESADAPPQFNPLNFVAPTEFVELPSKGLHYPESHPLHLKETVEIKYMTAKDEDILTSQTLLRKGLALERFLQNIILDKSIDINSLLIGDKNAILVSARGSGYGYDYETVLKCPQCSKETGLSFDLRSPKITGELIEDQNLVTQVSHGVFQIEMPLTKFAVNFRLMNGEDEVILTEVVKNLDQEKEENLMVNQYKRLILSIEGHEEQDIINQYVDNMPVIDSHHLKMCLKSVTPNIEIKETFKCRNCEYTQEVDVAFGTDFFWPNR